MILFTYFIYLSIVCAVLLSIVCQEKYLGAIIIMSLTLASTLALGLVDIVLLEVILIIFCISVLFTHAYFVLDDKGKRTFLLWFTFSFALISASVAFVTSFIYLYPKGAIW